MRGICLGSPREHHMIMTRDDAEEKLELEMTVIAYISINSIIGFQKNLWRLHKFYL